MLHRDHAMRLGVFRSGTVLENAFIRTSDQCVYSIFKYEESFKVIRWKSFLFSIFLCPISTFDIGCSSRRSCIKDGAK
jgi:hypothetical protein